jgi:putative component of toxin-antitoxin plasmid stabilization module
LESDEGRAKARGAARLGSVGEGDWGPCLGNVRGLSLDAGPGMKVLGRGPGDADTWGWAGGLGFRGLFGG